MKKYFSFIFSLLLLSTQSFGEQSATFFFQPQLSMNIGGQEIIANRFKLQKLISNPDFKKNLDVFLGVDAEVFLRSIQKETITLEDLQLFLLAKEADIKKSLHLITDVGLCDGLVPVNVQRLNKQLLASQLSSIYSADDKKLEDRTRLLAGLLHGKSVSEKTFTDNDKKIIKSTNAFVDLNAKLQKGTASEEELESAIVVINRINLDSKMLDDVLSDQEIAEIARFRRLSREEQLRLLRPADSAATVVIGLLIVTGYVAYQVAKSTVGNVCSRAQNTNITIRDDDYFDLDKPQSRYLEWSQLVQRKK